MRMAETASMEAGMASMEAEMASMEAAKAKDLMCRKNLLLST